MSEVTVRVPATSANLGPGFDVIGVALTLYNHFSFRVATDAVSTVIVQGEGEELSHAPNSLILQAAQRVAQRVGQELPPLSVQVQSDIPLQRGLGSSASAIVGGLLGANALLGEPLSQQALLCIATEMEGHPDNVAAALLGGVQVVVACGGPEDVVSVSLPLPDALLTETSFVVCIPALRLGTETSRGALPATVPFATASFSVGRASLLVTALCTGRTDLLPWALQDRLHQPCRTGNIPGFDQALLGARHAGAYGGCLSGSGSTILAIAPKEKAEVVGQAMVQTLHEAGVSSSWRDLQIDTRGAVIL